MKYLNNIFSSSQETDEPGVEPADHNLLTPTIDTDRPANKTTNNSIKAKCQHHSTYSVVFKQNSFNNKDNINNRLKDQALEPGDDYLDRVSFVIDRREAETSTSHSQSHNSTSKPWLISDIALSDRCIKDYQIQSLNLLKYLLKSLGAYNRYKIGRNTSKSDHKPTESHSESLSDQRKNDCQSTDQKGLAGVLSNDDTNDWIIVDREDTHPGETINNIQEEEKANISEMASNHVNSSVQEGESLLGAEDIKFIKNSWALIDQDHTASGILLFKGLFTRFPEYLKFFPQFSDLDLDNMHENKRLLRHAVKVIETVTFVVNAVDDESLASQLGDALTGLVRSHLRRNIGKAQFVNLKVVLIDFICEVNQKGSLSCDLDSMPKNQCQLNKSTNNTKAINSSIDSDTMTSALDKVRASTSPSSSSDDDSYLVSGSNNIIQANSEEANREIDGDSLISSRSEVQVNRFNSIDILATKVAWEKLYSLILDVVERESSQQ